jgi:hypothetical protein
MVVTAPRQPKSMTLSAWKRGRAGPIPSEDGGISWTADHVIDDPREPRVTPTGVLDHRGMMYLRVAMPIKVKMGFHLPGVREAHDEVHTVVTEDLLSISDCGEGIGSFSPDEVEDDEEEDEAERIAVIIREAMEQANGDEEALRTILAEFGIEITITEKGVG